MWVVGGAGAKTSLSGEFVDEAVGLTVALFSISLHARKSETAGITTANENAKLRTSLAFFERLDHVLAANPETITKTKAHKAIGCVI